MFTHLHVHTPYSFLSGASTIEALVRQAALYGMSHLAMTDHDNLSGVVKFAEACAAFGIRPLYGAELTMADGSHLTLLARDRTGYANLCSLITIAHVADRRTPRLPWPALSGLTSGLICLTGCRQGLVSRLVRERRYPQALAAARDLRALFGLSLYLELQIDGTPAAARVCRDLVQLGEHLGIRTVATNNVHYATPADAHIHDLLCCIKAGITVNDIDIRRPLNSDQWLKPERKMQALFAWHPEALASTERIAQQCDDVLPRQEEITPRLYGNATNLLRQRTAEGLRRRGKMDAKRRERINDELDLICSLGYADYVLMIHDIVTWARSQGIRAHGRGSGADSYVLYCLGLADIDPVEWNMPFWRFLRPGKVPDIDVDFPSDRRDEVYQYIIDTYGADKVAVCCTHHTYHARGAVRDLGKALALPASALGILSTHLSPWTGADELAMAFDVMPELRPHRDAIGQFETLFDLCRRIAGFPRHLGSHSSGIVISRVPLRTVAPVIPSARGIVGIWTLDKDDSETAGAIKFDVLALRMLGAVAQAEGDIRRHEPGFSVDGIPNEDAATYELLQSGSAVGVFQFESSAQLALAPRLHPRCFADLMAAVALIRPGPVRGNVVERFVGARNGWYRTDCLHPALYDLLAQTYGCVVYQEQATEVISRMMGCSEGEADQFRKGLNRHAEQASLDAARDEFIRRAMSTHKDLRPKVAFMIWEQIAGWGGYGFVQGHAGAFAMTGYRSAYLSVHHPAEFFAGLLSHGPLGFYSANSYASEARRRSIAIRGVDINESDDACLAEDEGQAIRLGLRLVDGLSKSDIAAILNARQRERFYSLVDLCRRVVIPRDGIENLILAGAFDAHHDGRRRGLLFGLDRAVALGLSYREAAGGAQGSIAFSGASLETPVTDVEEFSAWDSYLWAWRVTGVAVECHVMSHYREILQWMRFLTAYEATQQPHGMRVRVAGVNIRPHRPPTRSGQPVLFSSIEDETGLLGLVCAGDAIATCTSVFLLSQSVMVDGVIRRQGDGASLTVIRAKPFLPGDLCARAHTIGARNTVSERPIVV